MSRRYQPLNPQHAESIAQHGHHMRHAPSASERLLWSELAGSKLGVAFRRQFVVGRFVADFAAPSRRLLVEVDGGYHAFRSHADAARDAKLRRSGWRMLRIPAETVLHNLRAAVADIREALADAMA
jgi:very-short-patch-repair endonuclease